jgi:hypothetical protein
MESLTIPFTPYSGYSIWTFTDLDWALIHGRRVHYSAKIWRRANSSWQNVLGDGNEIVVII